MYVAKLGYFAKKERPTVATARAAAGTLAIVGIAKGLVEPPLGMPDPSDGRKEEKFDKAVLGEAPPRSEPIPDVMPPNKPDSENPMFDPPTDGSDGRIELAILPGPVRLRAFVRTCGLKRVDCTTWVTGLVSLGATTDRPPVRTAVANFAGLLTVLTIGAAA